MDKLWAPWREAYIINAQKKDRGCVFCRMENNGKNEHLIFSTDHSTARLNIYPYNNGHMLISPKKHVPDFSSLSGEEMSDFFFALETARTILHDELKPDGFNIGANIGRAAGAGIVDHVHMHIVPRWIGDTNFMTVMYSTKIISQSLIALHKQLSASLRKRKIKKIKVH